MDAGVAHRDSSDLSEASTTMGFAGIASGLIVSCPAYVALAGGVLLAGLRGAAVVMGVAATAVAGAYVVVTRRAG